MKKETATKILILSLFSILLISFVSAATQTATEFFNGVKDGFGSFIMSAFGTTWGTGVMELAFIKFLFAFLLFLIILAVTDFLPFLEGHKAIGVLFSAVVTYLSVMYITPADFYTILISYTTMAIVITSIIPLAIIFALMYGIALKPNAGKIILQKLLIGLYCLVLLYRIMEVMGWFGIQKPVEISPLALPLYGGTLVIMIILLFANQTVRSFILSSSVKGYLEVSETMSREEAEADAMILEERALILDKNGATIQAKNLREAAERLKKHATAISKAK